VDGPLQLFFLVHQNFSFSKFLAVVYLTPIFSVPGVAIAVLGAWLGRVYMKAQIATMREISNAKAPVLGHFGASVTGLSNSAYDGAAISLTWPPPSIYGAQLALPEESYRRIDKHWRASSCGAFHNMSKQVK
jgi:hypothetical protein